MGQQQKQGAGQWTMGRFKVHQEKKHVLHVGSAMVVFDKTYVAPLFLAVTTRNTPGSQSFSGNRAGTRQTFVPELEDAFWDPPVPSTCKHGQNVKRRLERRRWKTLRAAERQEKFDRA